MLSMFLILLTLPDVLDPKVFSPLMAIKLTADPDGHVRKVEIVRSSGIADVDRQLLAGARRWCMNRTRRGRDVTISINVDFH